MVKRVADTQILRLNRTTTNKPYQSASGAARRRVRRSSLRSAQGRQMVAARHRRSDMSMWWWGARGHCPPSELYGLSGVRQEQDTEQMTQGSNSHVHARACARDGGKESRGREERTNQGLSGAARPDDLSLIRRAHVVEGENGLKTAELSLASTPSPWRARYPTK